MKTLLWKEYRQNRMVLIFGATLLLLPYLFMSTLHIAHPLLFPDGRAITWLDSLLQAGLGSMILSLLTYPLLAGCVMAGERNDRSAEFLAYLPLSRRAIIAGKAIFTLTVCILIWSINILVFLSLAAARHVAERDTALSLSQHQIPSEPFLTLTATAVLMFGTAWFFSSFLKSPAIASCIGIASPLVIIGLIEAWAFFTDPNFWTQREAPAETWNVIACFAVGLLAFIAGVVTYTQRVEP